ncbi:AAA family ATPase [Amycolatopsis sp. PS_44_ISF1]|nr:AAA family ATPase [Amycolatopsis sp. PS_44_ISF1]
MPSQLPGSPPFLPCRDEELMKLDRFLARTGAEPPLVVISGPGGVGKSALALRWLHQVRDQFPDGQLYVDLGAFDATGPVPPETVLAWFLTAFGLTEDEIPESLPRREALYRTHTAQRRIAVLLDNAVSAGQVRPLVSSAQTVLTVVTSRWRLPRLAGEGLSVNMRPWDVEQSVQALTSLVGEERVGAEITATHQIAAVCGGLPLALSMIAAQLRTHPRRSVAREADRLGDESRLLRLSVDGDPELQAVFDSSYSSLTAETAAAYRLCGLHPGPRFGPEVLADVSGTTEDEIEDTFDRLAEVNLLSEEEDGSHRFHDLVRAHARATAQLDEGAGESAVTRRFIEWYLTMTVRATDVVHPHRWKLEPHFTTGAPAYRSFASTEEAMTWLRREHRSIRHCVLEAREREWHELVWPFCEALWGFFLHHRDYADWIRLQQQGIDSAIHCGHRIAEARLRSQRGYALAKSGDYAQAMKENELALRLARAEGHDASAATALSQLGRAARDNNDLPAALGYYRQARDLEARLGHRRSVALLSRRVGQVLGRSGRVADSITELSGAAAVLEETGDSVQHSRTLMVLGTLLTRHDRQPEGLRLLHEALRIITATGSPHYAAEVLFELGEAEAAAGRMTESADHLRRAYEHFSSAGDPRAGEVLTRLRNPGPVVDG